MKPKRKHEKVPNRLKYASTAILHPIKIWNVLVASREILMDSDQRETYYEYVRADLAVCGVLVVWSVLLGIVIGVMLEVL